MKGIKCRNCYHLAGEWCELVVDSPDIDMVRDCRYFRQKTNADRIRAMSDEELADFIQHIRTNTLLAEALGVPVSKEKDLEFVRQPVKDGDNE